MIKITNKNEKPKKKIIIGAVSALALIIILFFASASLFDILDQKKFEKLDAQIQTIFQKLKVASNGADDWKYEKGCTAELAGDWLTGKYYCTADISMEKTITSVDELVKLPAKYYPGIDADITLERLNELDYQLPGDFGVNFVVSSAYKEYKVNKSNTACGYSINLSQLSNNDALPYEKNVSFGSPINNGAGKATISFKCTEKTNKDWYSVNN